MNIKKLSSLVFVFSLLFLLSCGPKSGGEEKDISESAVDKRSGAQTEAVLAEGVVFKQAPMLDSMDLPPVEERLPENPKVVHVLNSIGKYGGTINKATTGVFNYLFETNNGESFFTLQYPDPSVGAPAPNVAESWEWNDAGTILTIHLRKGMKWSDGVPFTTEDWDFTWNDIWLSDGMTLGEMQMPGVFKLDGKSPKMTIIDDYSFSLEYEKPYYYAEEAIAYATAISLFWPKHYAAQFHPKYNKDATWDDFVTNLADLAKGRARVTLYPWMLPEDGYTPGTSITLVRNPYYWKVDTEGNQLPYADKVVFHVVEDRDTLALKAVAGEFDTDGMWINAAHVQLLLGEQEKRGFKIGWWKGVPSMAVYFNMAAEDSKLQEIFHDVNFRRASSILIDREDINQTIYSGLLETTGSSFHKTTPYYTEKAAKSWAEFNVAKAQKILSDAGYKDSDNNGILEAPNGRELKIIVDIVADNSLYVPSLEIMLPSFKKAGIELVINAQSHGLISERRDTGAWEMRIWDGDGFDMPLALTDDMVRWSVNDSSGFSGAYWNRKNAENPLEGYEEFQNIFMKAMEVPYEERVKIMQKANNMLASQCWILYIGPSSRPFFVGANIRNHPLEAARQDVSTPFMLYQTYLDR